MAKELDGLNVAILVEEGFEQVEMTEPRKALDQAGAKTHLIVPARTRVKAWDSTNWGTEFPVDVQLDDANPDDYGALLLPGGVMNPDRLRMIARAVKFVRDMGLSGKPIAVICHGPWTLINAGLVKGRTITSWPSLHIDLVNAGANWVNEQVVRDGNLLSSRRPDDIPAFNLAMIDLFAEARR